jgi:hypothetical protein
MFAVNNSYDTHHILVHMCYMLISKNSLLVRYSFVWSS